ncbi:hypothetical protein [Propionivibrio sp.]|uniref:hypothetical protein n=1 Tax=Propionivibrio sp. TaxID=2212460 RepID=UPI003BF03E50
MADYNITLDYSNQMLVMDTINEILAKQIHNSVGLAAQMVYEAWADGVMKTPGIWQKDRAEYVQSLKWDYTGPFSAKVSTDYKIADEIETGRPARDLKRMLQTSSKTRQGKNGKYLIIPIRHNAPSSSGHSSNARQMPAEIYAVARQLQVSTVTGSTTRISATGATVPQSIYDWGGRLPAGMAPKMKPTHVTDIYAGMVKTGEGNSSKSAGYLTFRRMSEKSSGWVIPAQPGKFIARDVALAATPDIEKIVAESMG